MPKTSIQAQASAVDVALAAFRSRALPKLRQSEMEMIERGLRASAFSLRSAAGKWRASLPDRFIAECEGE